MKIKDILLKIVLVTTLIFSAPIAATAQNSAIILTITGPEFEPIEYSLDDLNKLPVTQFETETIWTDGVQRFEGVLLSTLLEMTGITTGIVLATAVNDYAVEIPFSEILGEAPIIAYKLNDKLMSLREKGPLWVVYPYDSSVDYQTETIYSRSIWQLDRLQIKK